MKKTKKPKKVIQLKQYMVGGALPGADKIEKILLVLATSPVRAAEYFRKKYPGYNIWGSCTQVACSNYDETDLPNIPKNILEYVLQ